MSKEQRFHKLIQKQKSEEKEDLWNKIEQQKEEDAIVELGEGVLAKKQMLSKQNKIIICATVLLIAIVGIILICKFVSPNSEDDGFRYCEIGDYYSIDSDESICEYAAANNLNLLYFSWYKESLYYNDLQFKLESTDEIICLNEKLIDKNEVLIEQNITNNKTQIDFLKAYSELCNEQTTINSVKVIYGILGRDMYVCFGYEDYNYYFKIESTNEEYVLELIGDLIK